MRKSKDGNLREIRILDREAIYLVSQAAKSTRLSPTRVATLALISKFRRFRPKGDFIPENHHWQQENSADAGADLNAAAVGQEKGTKDGD